MHTRLALLLSALMVLSACPSPDDDDAAAGDDDDGTEEGPDPLAFPVAELGPFQVGWRGWDLSYSPVGQDDA
ncbi:MAG: hypothetical protein KDA24_14850, partial [Deltaproteobacteria bacterium]|nr:hypothetical protein [Deltaproteobacteria bacterium]